MSERRRRLAAAHLYAITPDREPGEVERIVAACLRGGADVVQLRHKSLGRDRLYDLALVLREAAARAGALLIVNDHLDIAMAVGADGVHLGADDLSVEGARSVAGPDLLIGASANTPEAARTAVAAGADHVGCGPAFATPVKPAKAVIGPEGVASVARAVEVPVFAIGGVAPGNLDRLLAAGIRRACVIGALAEAEDPEAVARAMRERLAA